MRAEFVRVSHARVWSLTSPHFADLISHNSIVLFIPQDKRMLRPPLSIRGKHYFVSAYSAVTILAISMSMAASDARFELACFQAGG